MADKTFDATDEDATIKFLGQVYKIVQALWVHGQSKQETEKDDCWKLIWSSSNSIRETRNKWAIKKANLIVSKSSNFHEMEKQSSDHDDSCHSYDEENNEDEDSHQSHKDKQQEV